MPCSAEMIISTLGNHGYRLYILHLFRTIGLGMPVGAVAQPGSDHGEEYGHDQASSEIHETDEPQVQTLEALETLESLQQATAAAAVLRAQVCPGAPLRSE